MPARSLKNIIIPGMYQLKTGQRTKGNIILGTSALTALSTTTFGLLFKYAKDNTKSKENAYFERLKIDTGRPISDLFLEWKDSHNHEKSMRNYAIYSGITMIATIVVHTLDVMFYPRDKECLSVSNTFPTISFKKNLNNNYLSLSLKISFQL